MASTSSATPCWASRRTISCTRSTRRRRCSARKVCSDAEPFAQRAIFVDQEIAVVALFLGELEEDLLALGVLEPLAVLLEELVRVALALDADEQRLQVVDARLQLLGAFGEDAVRRALEE